MSVLKILCQVKNIHNRITCWTRSVSISIELKKCKNILTIYSCVGVSSSRNVDENPASMSNELKSADVVLMSIVSRITVRVIYYSNLESFTKLSYKIQKIQVHEIKKVRLEYYFKFNGTYQALFDQYSTIICNMHDHSIYSIR